MAILNSLLVLEWSARERALPPPSETILLRGGLRFLEKFRYILKDLRHGVSVSRFLALANGESRMQLLHALTQDFLLNSLNSWFGNVLSIFSLVLYKSLFTLPLHC